MIMVDTSVWVEYFNGRRNTHTDLLDTLLYNDEVVLGDLILMEILQGFRNDRDYALAKSRLAKLTIFELLGVDAAQQCAENYRQLRKLGSTVRKSVDVIIASFCLEKRIPLLFLDRDFRPFVEHLKLQDAAAEMHRRS